MMEKPGLKNRCGPSLWNLDGDDYIHFFDQHMMLIVNREIITRKHFVLDPAISRALAHDNREIIINYLTFKQFKDRDMIYCPYLLERRKWVVIIVNVLEKTVTGYNTQLLECSEVLRNMCENFAKR